MRKLFIAAVLALFSLVTAHAGAINTKCPVSGKDSKRDVEVPFSFCCEKCKAKFDKAPADYLEVAAAAEDGKCPLSGKAVDKDVTSKVSIGVCCEKCETKLTENPKAYLGKVEAK